MIGDLGTIISRIRKNKAETVVVRLVEFHGHQCCDLRAFVESEDSQSFIPTKKGLAFNVNLIPDIIAGLQEVNAEFDRRKSGRAVA